MSLVVPEEGEKILLETLMSYWNGDVNHARIGLFISNHAPDAADVFADYDAIKATFDGYDSIGLNSWGTVNVPDGSGRSYVSETLRTWIASGLTNLPQTVYGYYVFDNYQSKLLWAELAAVPVVFTLVGAFYAVIPKFTLLSEF